MTDKAPEVTQKIFFWIPFFGALVGATIPPIFNWIISKIHQKMAFKQLRSEKLYDKKMELYLEIFKLLFNLDFECAKDNISHNNSKDFWLAQKEIFIYFRKNSLLISEKVQKQIVEIIVFELKENHVDFGIKTNEARKLMEEDLRIKILEKTYQDNLSRFKLLAKKEPDFK